VARVKPSGIPPNLASKLWDHQKRAIAFALSRLRGASLPPASLIRMPTGTGKTGIVATLAIAAPPAGWTLVLTPWANLCDQLIDDLKQGFWGAPINWSPPVEPHVERLFPRNLNRLLALPDPTLVLVSTLATLVTIFKRDVDGYRQLSEKLAQVLVDEGHYEPAVEWGQAVKRLQRPTLLLTATPYRNDLKLFRVTTKDTFHFTHEDAEAAGIVRKVAFRSIGVPEPVDDSDLPTWCDAFARFWKSPEPRSLHGSPRAIICCASKGVVQRVTILLRDRGIRAMGLHERLERSGKTWLLTDVPDPQSVSFDVWVHQNKLTEGLDDHRFCVVALLNRIRNDRKLVQQVGRVLRPGPQKAGKPKAVGHALVLFSDDLSCQRSWINYRDFETHLDVTQSERYRKVLGTLLREQPMAEYFASRFRRRLEPSHVDLGSQVLLRASAVVRRKLGTFKLVDFTDFASDFLLLEDRILLGPTEDFIEHGTNARLWVYALIRNSTLLAEHSLYELRLGAMAAVEHGDLLFLSDTEGAYPSDYLDEHTVKVGHSELARVFSPGMVPKEAALSRPWPVAGVVRRSSISAEDLSRTPAQLTDAVLVCDSMRATTKPKKRAAPKRRHYVGFPRGRVSEDLRSVDREAFSIAQFVDWAVELAARLQSSAALPAFFRRYMLPIVAPAIVEPRFLVLNLFEGNTHLEDDRGRLVELLESIVPIQDAGPGKPGLQISTFRLQYRAAGRTRAVDGRLVYDRTRSRFRFQGESLDSSLLVSSGDGPPDGLPTFLNKNPELFSVALQVSDVFYSGGSFFAIDYSHAEERLGSMLTAWAGLDTTDSEKGARRARGTGWPANSVFGIIADLQHSGLLHAAFGSVELLFCDDLGTEVADFVCADFSGRRIAFIHAKQGEGRQVSASALHDVVGQAMKNLAVLRAVGGVPAHINRWDRTSTWNRTAARRWRRGPVSLPIRQALWKRIRAEILDHPAGTTEVWLVLGQTLSRASLLGELADPGRRDTITGQVVQLLSGLSSECAQRGVLLRVFCH
jgi:superfamily II DNA or RNA helicase